MREYIPLFIPDPLSDPFLSLRCGFLLSGSDLIPKPLQPSLQILEAGGPKEYRRPEDDKLRERILSVLNPESNRKQAAMSAQLPDRPAGKVVFTPEAREMDCVRVGGESSEWGSCVDPIEPQSAGLRKYRFEIFRRPCIARLR
jgi:hypothetical protein